MSGRGVGRPSMGAVLVGPGSAVVELSRGVHWWHDCSTEQGWRMCGLANHTITGSIADDTLTIHASLLCPEGCGRHGWITDMTWTDA